MAFGTSTQNLLLKLSRPESWVKGGALYGLFSESSDVDRKPSYTEIIERLLQWVEKTRFDSGDIPFLEGVQGRFQRNSSPWKRMSRCITQISSRALFGQGATSVAKERVREQKRQTFERLTRNLQGWEGKVVERQPHLGSFLAWIEEGNWDISRYSGDLDELAWDALAALHGNLLSMEQFCTILFRWSIARDFPDGSVEEIPLFSPDGTVHPLAEGLLLRTFTNTQHPEAPPWISREQFEVFLEKMRKKPLSERTLFLLRRIPKHELTIRDQIVRIGINIGGDPFLGSDTPEKGTLLVPSFSMLQEWVYLFAEDPENGVDLLPVLGMSMLEDILENGRTGTRDMGIPFPGVEVSKEPDGWSTDGDVEFWGHDFYHALIASLVPDRDRQACIRIAELLLENASGISKELAEKLLDMEHSYYRKDLQKFYGTLPDEAFLRSIWNRVEGLLQEGQRDSVQVAQEVQAAFTQIESTLQQEETFSKIGLTPEKVNAILRKMERKSFASPLLWGAFVEFCQSVAAE